MNDRIPSSNESGRNISSALIPDGHQETSRLLSFTNCSDLADVAKDAKSSEEGG
jgi:hypothetical protein